jgi:DNA polymerase-3 subunit gamma/tau
MEESGAAPAGAAADAASALEALWARLAAAAGRASPFVKSYLLEAHPVSFSGNLFTIGFAPEVAEHLSLVDNPRNHTLLQTKLAELGHANAQIKFIKAEPPADRVIAAAPAPPEPEPAAAPAPAPAGPATTPAMARPTPAKEKPVAVPFNKDDFKNDPLIQKALEIFKGKIVQVQAAQ